MSKKTMGAIISLLLLVPAWIYGAWVAKTMWWWFLVPLGLPSIGMAWVYGITVLAWVFGGSRSVKPDSDNALIGVLLLFLKSSIALTLGYIAHWLMGRP